MPVATIKNFESGENSKAVTLSRKLKWANTTLVSKLMIKLKPSTSIETRIRLLGDKWSDAIFDRFWNGKV